MYSNGLNKVLTLKGPAKTHLKMLSAKVACCIIFTDNIDLLTNLSIKANIVDQDPTAPTGAV